MAQLSPLQKAVIATPTDKVTVISALLSNLADQTVADLGQDPNGDIARAIRKAVQDTWELRDALEEIGYW